ncbi:MAG: NADH-quinone oxidoreductase subunit A [bacterium]
MINNFISQYSYVLVFAIVGFLYVVLVLSVSRIISPFHPSKEKSYPYECGLVPMGEPWGQLNIRYYVFALLFVLFDVETVFMYPWAVIFKKIGWNAFWSMLTFIAIIAFGLVYAWKKGVLEWL